MEIFTALTASYLLLITVSLTGGVEKNLHGDLIPPFSWLHENAEDAKAFLIHREKRGFWEFFGGDDDTTSTTSTTTSTTLPTTTTSTTTTTPTTTTTRATQRPRWRPTPATQRPRWRPTPATQRPRWRPTTTTQRPRWRQTTTTQRPRWRPTPATQRPWWRPTPTTQRPELRPIPSTQRPQSRPSTPHRRYGDITTTTTARPWWKIFVGKEDTTVTATSTTTTPRPPHHRARPTRRPHHRQTRPPQGSRTHNRPHRYGNDRGRDRDNNIPVYNPVISNNPRGSIGKDTSSGGYRQGAVATPGGDSTNVQRAPPGVPVFVASQLTIDSQSKQVATLRPPTPRWHRPEVKKRIILERQRERHSPDYRRHLRAWLRKWRLSGGAHYRNRLLASRS